MKTLFVFSAWLRHSVTTATVSKTLMPHTLEAKAPNCTVMVLSATLCLQRKTISLKKVLDEAVKINDY